MIPLFNKKYAILILIFFVSLVSAIVIDLTLQDATIPPIPSEFIQYGGNITFNCGEEPMKRYMSEPNLDIDDDIESFISNICNQTATSVIDWTGRTYKQNEFGLRSFDQDKLREDVCVKNDQDYNKTSRGCQERLNETRSLSPEVSQYQCVIEDSIRECPGGLSGGQGTRCYLNILKTTWDSCSSGWIEI